MMARTIYPVWPALLVAVWKLTDTIMALLYDIGITTSCLAPDNFWLWTVDSLA